MSVWKSSALAPFYHGLDRVGDDEYLTARIMEKQAESADVRLQHSLDITGDYYSYVEKHPML
jgi:hypothetical protein